MAAVRIEGSNASEPIVSTSVDARHVLESATGGAPDFDGDARIFELLLIRARNSGSTNSPLEVYDEDETTGTSDSSFTTKKGGDLLVPANTQVEFTWEKGTGPRFRTNIIVGSASGAGTFLRGSIHAAGLLH